MPHPPGPGRGRHYLGPRCAKPYSLHGPGGALSWHQVQPTTTEMGQRAQPPRKSDRESGSPSLWLTLETCLRQQRLELWSQTDPMLWSRGQTKGGEGCHVLCRQEGATSSMPGTSSAALCHRGSILSLGSMSHPGNGSPGRHWATARAFQLPLPPGPQRLATFQASWEHSRVGCGVPRGTASHCQGE